jgi:hypothetical protein
MPLRSWLAHKLDPVAYAHPTAYTQRPASQRPAPERQRLSTTEDADEDWRPLTAGPGLATPWAAQRALLERAHAACDTNPLAARLVHMTADFVLGSGARLVGGAYARAFWDDPLNRMDRRIVRWCEELARSGELFIVLSRNPISGMAYVREVPALLIDAVRTDPDDLERALDFHQLTEDPAGRTWPSALDEAADQVMLHFAINRPVGEVRGRSDLAQVLPWLERYALWLEDRVRINRYKGAYLWHVSVENAAPGALEAKRAQYGRVPRPGSIIVTDASERWQAVQPQINADDVQADGRAMRLMIAAGAGVPLHYLAEGESANYATAREMGTATFRHYARRQRDFADLVTEVIRIAARRAGHDESAARVTFESVLAQDARGEGEASPQRHSRRLCGEHRKEEEEM